MKSLANNIIEVDHLPVVEVKPVKGEGFYVVVDGRQWARFEQYGDAVACSSRVVASMLDGIV
jgi:hypothetical protein